MYKLITLMILFVLYSACNSDETNMNFIRFPKLINTALPDSISGTYDTAIYIESVNPVCLGKFKYSEVIDISKPIIDTNDILYERTLYNPKYRADSFTLLVDYKSKVRFNRYFRFIEKLKPFPTTYFYYPVYFLNQSEVDLVFQGKSGHAFGIQEAINPRDENWHPIEMEGFDFCNNGFWNLVVHPDEFVIVLMKKYVGEIKSKYRVRFKLKDSIYISKEFIGDVNLTQFLFEPRFREHYNKYDKNDLEHLFYGATLYKEEINK